MLKIARYFPDIDARGFGTIDYRTDLPILLHQYHTYFKGEVQQIGFYATSSIDPISGGILYSDLVVRESFSYLRDINGMLQEETKTVLYYNESNAPEESLVIRRYLEVAERYEERRITRISQLDNLQKVVIDLLITTEPTNEAGAQALIVAFTDTFLGSINSYVYTGSTALSAALTADTTTTWLSNNTADGGTIRDVILAELS